MQLSINAREVQAVTVLDLSGDFMSPEGHESLREHVKQLLARNKKHILLHLANVGQIDSGGLGTLVQVVVSSGKQGGKVKLLNPSAVIQVALEMTGLIRMLDVYPTEPEALASFK